MKKFVIGCILIALIIWIICSSSLVNGLLLNGKADGLKEYKKLGNTLEGIDTQENIRITNPVGNISIKPFLGNEIKVFYEKCIKTGLNRETIEKLLDKIEVNISRDVQGINISVMNKNRVDINEGQFAVNLDILLPIKIKKAEGVVDTGNIKFEDINFIDEFKATLNKGEIEVFNSSIKKYSIDMGAGNLYIKNSKGNGIIGKKSGNSDILNLSGDLVFRSDSGNFCVDGYKGILDVTSGNVQITYAMLKAQSSIHSISGKVTASNIILDPSGDYSISSGTGDIKLNILDDSKFKIKAKTASGKIKNNFGLIPDNKNREINGLVGKWGPSLNISSVSGNIYLYKQLWINKYYDLSFVISHRVG